MLQEVSALNRKMEMLALDIKKEEAEMHYL